jgi:penicillin-binding protein 1C
MRRGVHHVVGVCVALLMGTGLSQAATQVLPSFAEVRAAHIPSEAWLLDRRGRLLQTVRVNPSVRRLAWVPLSNLSPALVDALLASEDKRFMQHKGVDWVAIVSAMWDNLTDNQRRGASTLTMQLAGLLDPALHRAAGGRSMGQKWNQIVAARALEKSWRKEQILEAYLNLVHFRGELAGIGAASHAMYGKAPSGLNRNEASILAALLRGPNAKADLVATRACGVAMSIIPPSTQAPDCKSIKRLAMNSLEKRGVLNQDNQLAPHLARRFKLKPGQTLRTSVDVDLQIFVLSTLKRQLMELKNRAVEDGAVVVLDNATGQVLAWVGASDATSQSAEVDGVTAPRLPGSTLKPFLYAAAIERGLLTAASPLEDSPLALDTPVGQYVPQNYERDFKGWVSVRTALGSSLNVPAVRTLLLLGVDRFHAELKALGLNSLRHDADFYGYSLALGGGETTLLELANAYRSLANGGVLRPVTWLPTSNRQAAGKPIFSRQTAYIVSDMLADKAARSLSFGLSSPLETVGHTAVKTGTSKDMRDNWSIGYSDRYTVAVWVGNNSGAPMHDVSGVTGAAPIWQAIMNELQRHRPGKSPARPPGVHIGRIHYEPAIEPERLEMFRAGTAQERIIIPAEVHHPRIEGPGNGAVLAIDPDIPATRQKVRFRIANMQPSLTWYMNDKAIDPDWLDADGSLLWPLTRGSYRVSVQTSDGKLIDAMFFTVK